jgi:uncharacterized Zn finger protein
MEVADGADLHSAIELWLETKETDRLAARVGRAKHSELEGLSHFMTEPAAKRLARPHPEVAARIFRALGMRILKAGRSKHYHAAIAHFAAAKACQERAGVGRQWRALVAAVRRGHRRKAGFMSAFERLVTGQGPRDEPSFLERAKSRWPSP